MKIKLFGIALAAVFAVIGFAPAVVSAAPAQTDITGVITESGNPVANAVVTVKCMGFTEVDGMTDAHGSYLVIFTIAECPFGSTVKVAAKKGTMSGAASGTVQGITTKLNVGVVNVSIPEFGMMGGIVAGGAGLGSIAFMRRRSSQNSKNV